MDRRRPPADRRERAADPPQSRQELARLVTSLHQAVAALAHSEQQLKAAERLAHVGSWQWDEATSVGTWSDELFRIFGLPGPAPSGAAECIELVHPDDQAQVRAAVATAYAERRPFQFSFRIVRPDGAIRTLHTHNEVVTNAAGGVAGLRSAVQDVTESENVHQALGESEERYHALFEDNPHPLWVYDPGTLRFLDVNGVAVAHYGYSRAEFLAMTILDLHGPDDKDAVLRAVGQAREKLHVTGQWRHRRKDGSLIEVEISSHETRFGGRTARLVLASDVTERILLEDQFRQAQKMDAVGRLAGGVAHDFNNILGVILGYGEMVRRGLPGQHPLQGKVAEIMKAGERAAALTRQLLTFSRKQVVQPRILDLNIVTDDMEKMLRRLIGEDIQLDTVAGEGLGSVEADPSQLEQVVLNLAVNARDAMPNGGKLIIETRNVELDAAYVRTHTGARVGPHVMLAVSDTGHGMDAETIARIFEPFFTTKPVGKGTGLGLSTVYGIVTGAGGHVAVHSKLGSGTTFKVFLPSVSAADEVGAGLPGRLAPPTGSETVLVVEDEAALRDVIRDVLDQAGYRVITAVGPKEAITAAAGHRGAIDVVLTDVVMPEMNGPDLVRNLAPLVPGARAIFMSGYTDEAIGHHGLIDPDVLFLQKPFTAEQLLWKIRDAVPKDDGRAA